MSSSAARQKWRDRRTSLVMRFADKHGMSVNPLNNGYQLRIENLVDVYPTNGRYCILQSGERGGWETADDLKAIMLKALPEVKVVEVPPLDTHRLEVLTGVKTISEHEYMKWYRRLWRWVRRAK